MARMGDEAREYVDFVENNSPGPSSKKAWKGQIRRDNNSKMGALWPFKKKKNLQITDKNKYWFKEYTYTKNHLIMGKK